MTGEAVKSSKRDWRWLTGLLVLGYALLAIGLPALKIVSGKQLLQGLGVAALDHPFMDLRGIAAWCDASKEGRDPAVVETWISLPGSAESYPNFLMNYAPTVLLLGKLGLSADSVVWWGAGLALLYAASLWMLLGPCSLRRAIFWALLICSPASVLAVERGNLDILLFVLLVAALLLRKHPWTEILMILGAASLKFFPIAALLAPWRDGRKSARVTTLAACAFFLVFLGLLHAHLAAIAGSLSAQYQTAFGCTTIPDLLIHRRLLSGTSIGGAHMLLKFAALIGLGGSLIAGCFLRPRTQENNVSERSLHAFFLTVPIMLGLFVLGPQMDYKWIFFLFMVPAGLELSNSSIAMESLPAKGWLCAVGLYSYWTFFSDEGSLRNSLLKQALMWMGMLLSAFLAGGLWNRKNSPS